MFGATAAKLGALFCTELVADLRTIGDAELNEHFRHWKAAVNVTKKAGGGRPSMARLAAGSQLPLFEDEGVGLEVLGPIEEQVGGVPALRMLHAKPGASGYSASHTDQRSLGGPAAHLRQRPHAVRRRHQRGERGAPAVGPG